MGNSKIKFKMVEVESSTIKAIGHNDEHQTLRVDFKNRSGKISTYHYNPFTKEGFKVFVRAKSQGKFFHQFIKKNEAFETTKIN